MVGGIVVALISRASLAVSGPAAGLTVIVLDGIENLGSFDGFLVAVILAGVFQLAFGFAKAGIVALFFPNSVIKGMLAAIGIITHPKTDPSFFLESIQTFYINRDVLETLKDFERTAKEKNIDLEMIDMPYLMPAQVGH